jgi:hypothetical protein
MATTMGEHLRAVDDPIKLRHAARIFRAALARRTSQEPPTEPNGESPTESIGES